jgi:hypothetical protein
VKHRRGKNLEDESITRIAALLDGWSGKLTWDLLLDAVERHLRVRYTRQALNNHARIPDAFRHRKKMLAASSAARRPNGQTSPELAPCLERIARLEGENQRLRDENDRFLAQFVRWAHNAYLHGVDKQTLDRELPLVDRERTRVPRSSRKITTTR